MDKVFSELRDFLVKRALNEYNRMVKDTEEVKKFDDIPVMENYNDNPFIEAIAIKSLDLETTKITYIYEQIEEIKKWLVDRRWDMFFTIRISEIFIVDDHTTWNGHLEKGYDLELIAHNYRLDLLQRGMEIGL